MSEPIELTTEEHVAPTLNLCDRVEILTMMVHDEKHPLTLNMMDFLLDHCYEALADLCDSLRGEMKVTHAVSNIVDDGVLFEIGYADQSSSVHGYHECAPFT